VVLNTQFLLNGGFVFLLVEDLNDPPAVFFQDGVFSVCTTIILTIELSGVGNISGVGSNSDTILSLPK